MTWLRANWRHVLTGLVLLAVVTGWVSAARYRGMAEAAGREAERLTKDVEAQAAAVARARAEVERVERETARRRAADVIRLSELEDALASSERENAQLEAAAEAEAAAHDGWIRIETHRDVVAGLRRQLAVADSLRDVEREGKLQERRRGDALAVQVTELTADVELLERREVVRLEQIAALEAAAGAPRGLSFDLGADWPWMAVGAALGFLVAEAR